MICNCKDLSTWITAVLIGILIVCVAGSPAGAISADDLYYETIFLHGMELGSGGRALALGGAYRAISDDLSGLYYNPAGLAAIRKIEFTLGMSQSLMRDDAQIDQAALTTDVSRTRMDELGVIFPLPTYRGSLVFALGYQLAHFYDAFGSFATTYSDFTTFQGDELESGRLGIWSLGGAIDLSPQVSVGLALRLWTGYNDYSWDAYTYTNPSSDSTYHLTSNLDLSGFNLLGGLVYRATPWLRFGATLETPLKLSLEESFEEFWRNRVNFVDSTDAFSAAYTYHQSRSFRGALGAALLFKRFGCSADVVLTDWSQITYNDEPPFDGLTQEQANQEVMRKLHPTADVHLGAEYWASFAPLRFQIGYAYLASPFKGAAVLGNKTIISGGLSVLVDPSVQMQVSVAGAAWDRTLGGWEERLHFYHGLITLSYRF